MTQSIRDLVYEISPPFMRDEVTGKLNQAMAMISDALAEKLEQGIRASLPGIGTPTALPFIGNDRNIERGPSQTDAGYTTQLQLAFDTWRNAGGARTVLSQLRAYFAPNNGPPIRLVSQHPSLAGVSKNAIWHVINTATGVVTKTYHDNWLWDATSKWHRGWAIIEGVGIWNADRWDQVGVWGDGGVWGSDMTYDTARSLTAILKKWKPANVLGQMIVTLSAGIFAESNTRPPNPNGNGSDDAWQATVAAMFMEPQIT